MPRKKTQEEVIQDFKRVHGDTYDYSKVEYVNNSTKVKIICSKHGEFEQAPHNHKLGQNCAECGKLLAADGRRLTKEQIIKEFTEVHKDRYDYSLVEYNRKNTPVQIVCKEHGSFYQTPEVHIAGNGCSECSGNKRYNTQGIIKEFKAIHGDRYDYSLVDYKSGKKKVKIICKEHGEFLQQPYHHRKGSNCPVCGQLNRNKNIAHRKPEVIEHFKVVHGDRYNYDKVEYTVNIDPVEIICEKHGSFFQMPNAHKNGHGCRECGKIESRPEKEIADYLESLGLDVERNVKGLMENRYLEADILLRDHNIIVEYNGLRWHSEHIARDPYNIKNKTQQANEAGYRCIHIREDQYLENKELIKNLLKSAVGMYDYRIGARETDKRPITDDEYKLICKDHLQGWRSASTKVGLYFKDILVAAIGYNSTGELIRYIVKNGWQVLGALPKLIKSENILFSFCDLSFFDGKSYKKAGFKLHNITDPNYRYVRSGKSVSRQYMMKHKLHKRFDNFDPALTEVQNCNNNGWYRLFDAGNAKYTINQ